MTTSVELSGLSSAEVRQRIAEGQVNVTTHQTNRTTGQIIRDNIFTRFNLLLGALLFIVLVILREPRDGLFGLVLLSNSLIGIIQEIRAKRTLDSLELIAMPKVRLIRNGASGEYPVEDVVVDDLIELRSGDQIVVDAVIVGSNGLEIDESLLTGESHPVRKQPDDEVLSGSFVIAGSGYCRATRVGDASYAAQLAAEAKNYSLARSELREGINWILTAVSWAVVPVGAAVLWTTARGTSLEAGLTSAVAAGVALIPQGLVLLTSVAFALGVIRLGRRKVLVQELPAIEGLARVDVVCFDKTGTLTEGRLAFNHIVPLTDSDVEAALGALVAAASESNSTHAALAEVFTTNPGWRVHRAVPFSSERKWSGATFVGHDSWVLGAPEVLAPGQAATAEAQTIAATGARVLLLGRTESPLTDSSLPSGIEPVALVVLSDLIRSDALETIGYFAEQQVTLKVISGDSARTVASVANQVGIEGADHYLDGSDLPDDPAELARAMEENAVFGRVSPQQKKAMVAALQSEGHVVAMVGDGVNDVLALKEADIGVAVGNGAPASRAVAKLILVDGRFASMPHIVAEGRRVIYNIERVANLFITSTVYALGLALAVTVAGLPYPFLPRHLTLVGSLTVGIPSFFLALEATHRRARPGFVARVLRFALPVGLVATASTFFGYLVAEGEGATVNEARTVATLILATVGFYAMTLVSRPLNTWKRVLIGSLITVLVLVFLLPPFQEFFALALPRQVLVLAATGIAAVTGTLMWLVLRAIGWTRVVPAFVRERLRGVS